MRTTLVIDDDLYREIKALAAKSGITVTSVVERSLRDTLERTSARPAPRLPVLPQTGGTRSGVDLRDNAAIRDLDDLA